MPGFGAVVAIVALVAASVLAFRRNREDVGEINGRKYYKRKYDK